VSDPFADWVDSSPLTTSAINSEVNNGQARMLLPITLALLTFIGALSPWIVLRPLGKDASSYNLTDIPGGMGILVTIFVFGIISSIVMVWKRLAGMVMLSLSVVSLGWMASISGILLGTLSSLIPAIEVAGIDLSRAQLGQGSGVVVSALSSLVLAFLCIRQLDPVNRYSPAFEFPVVQIAALIPVLILTTSIHQGWVTLGNSESEWNAVVPGDALYGSGLLNLALWISIGIWLTSVVLRKSFVVRCAGVVGVMVGLVTFGYAVFTWIGGNALSWLLPSSTEGWASITIEPGLYLTAFCAVAMVGLGVFSFFVATDEKTVRLPSRTRVGSLSVPTSDLVAYLLWALTVMVVMYFRLI
jgi:hypothetical protein